MGDVISYHRARDKRNMRPTRKQQQSHKPVRMHQTCEHKNCNSTDFRVLREYEGNHAVYTIQCIECLREQQALGAFARE